jgi:hypothetical protein
MTIREIVGQALSYARTCRSLWLFGFFVGLASGGSSGGGSGGGNASAGAAGIAVSGTDIAPIAIVIVLAVIAALMLMRFVGEGALITGIVRARQGETLTTREGFRVGWAHWGVLLRIGLIYLAATVGSLLLFAAPCLLALLTFGPVGGIVVGIPAIVIAVPWLVTLYLVQAFAWRIAVIENRHAFDAIEKARLFLHGRIIHGLKLIVATLVGTVALVIVALVAIVPVVLLLIALIPVLRIVPVVAIGCLVLLPAFGVFTAIVGTFRSSIWTLGYMAQVES